MRDVKTKWDQTKRPIFDPVFWAERLKDAEERGQIHYAVFATNDVTFDEVAKHHKMILERLIHPTDSVIDVACGYGRLLSLMPATWTGDYIGVDLADVFITKARADYPDKQFILGDVRNLESVINQRSEPFDWAVCVGFKQMLMGHSHSAGWNLVETQLRLLSKRILVLEYDMHPEEVL